MNTFRDAVCARTGIRAEDFAGWVLARVMYGHARVSYKLLSNMVADYGFVDRDLIARIAESTDLKKVKSEIELYRTSPENRGFWRGTLKMRLSSRKLLELARLHLSVGLSAPPFAETRPPM